MMHKLSHILVAISMLFVGTMVVCCTDEESNLGLTLVDSTTLYHGVADTFYLTDAYSIRDTHLVATSDNYISIGNYHDDIFGHVSSELYTQIALPTAITSVNFDSVIIDSVVLTLVKERIFPDTNGTYPFHFEVRQLAEALQQDSSRLVSTKQEADNNTLFFDSTLTISASDTVVRMLLDKSIYHVLAQSSDAETFISNAKGLRIAAINTTDNGIITFNLSATESCLTLYFRFGNDTITSEYTFNIGSGTVHYTYFEHDYTSSVVGGEVRIAGDEELYLEGLGGYNINISFDKAVKDFAMQHPRAAIHHAELLLPVSSTQTLMPPVRLLAQYINSVNTLTYVPDLLDSYTYAGFDGYYRDGIFRMRVTQYLQNMLRKGEDSGTTLIISNRRYRAERTVIDSKNIRLAIVYSE